MPSFLRACRNELGLKTVKYGQLRNQQKGWQSLPSPSQRLTKLPPLPPLRPHTTIKVDIPNVPRAGPLGSPVHLDQTHHSAQPPTQSTSLGNPPPNQGYFTIFSFDAQMQCWLSSGPMFYACCSPASLGRARSMTNSWGASATAGE